MIVMIRRLCLAGLPVCTDVTNIIPEKVRLAKGVRTKNRKKKNYASLKSPRQRQAAKRMNTKQMTQVVGSQKQTAR